MTPLTDMFVEMYSHSVHMEVICDPSAVVSNHPPLNRWFTFTYTYTPAFHGFSSRQGWVKWLSGDSPAMVKIMAVPATMPDCC